MNRTDQAKLMGPEIWQFSEVTQIYMCDYCLCYVHQSTVFPRLGRLPTLVLSYISCALKLVARIEAPRPLNILHWFVISRTRYHFHQSTTSDVTSELFMKLLFQTSVAILF